MPVTDIVPHLKLMQYQPVEFLDYLAEREGVPVGISNSQFVKNDGSTTTILSYIQTKDGPIGLFGIHFSSKTPFYIENSGSTDTLEYHDGGTYSAENGSLSVIVPERVLDETDALDLDYRIMDSNNLSSGRLDGREDVPFPGDIHRQAWRDLRRYLEFKEKKDQGSLDSLSLEQGEKSAKFYEAHARYPTPLELI